MNAKMSLSVLIILGGCTSTGDIVGSSSSGAISAATNAFCGFVPSAADVAAIFEITGAAKIKQAATVICDAVNKKKKEIIAQRNATELAGGEAITKLPAGTKVSVVIEGKTVSGLTSR
ncbi:hypothetical protein [Sinorhizobium fredii]|uniref:hypothetical protein n=1 Tax=Rhizobium fredii TaxID=380 RepID=UPI0035182BC1